MVWTPVMVLVKYVNVVPKSLLAVAAGTAREYHAPEEVVEVASDLTLLTSSQLRKLESESEVGLKNVSTYDQSEQ